MYTISGHFRVASGWLFGGVLTALLAEPAFNGGQAGVG
jgi:hypothetical protein